VGALSLASPEFLVPLFATAAGEMSRVRVFIAAFRDPDREISAAGAAMPDRYYSLPLPAVAIRAGGEWSQVFQSFGRLDSSPDLELGAWVEAFSEQMEKMGDTTLADTARENGHRLTSIVSTSIHGPQSAPGAAKSLLTCVYKSALGLRGVSVEVLRRGVRVPAGTEHETMPREDTWFLSEVLALLAGSGNRRAALKGRGVLKVEIGGDEHIIKRVTRVSESHYRVLCSPFRWVDVEVGKNRTHVTVTRGGRKIHTGAVFMPFGSLTLLRVAAFGRLGHIPWYAKRERRLSSTKGAALVPAVEYVTAVCPKDSRPSAGTGAVGGRLKPAGSTLLDYKNPAINRYINAVLGQPGETHARHWILEAIQELASGRPIGGRRCRRRARWAVRKLRDAFLRRMAAGRHPAGFSQARTSDFCDLLKILFELTALLVMQRRACHPKSFAGPGKACIGALVDSGFATGARLSSGLVLDYLSEVLSKLRGRSVVGWEPVSSKCTTTIGLIATEEMPPVESERTIRGLCFPVYGEDGWHKQLLLLRRLEDILVEITIWIWKLGDSLLQVNLWALLLLGGPNALPTVEDVGRRFLKTIDGHIILERSKT